MSLHKKLTGRDLHSPSNEQVENNSGSTINAMTCVNFSAMGSIYPSITPAVGGTDLVRGITQSDILNGSTGVITSLGLMTGINTSSWAPGTKLYCGFTGNLTSSPIGLPVGVVLKQNATTGVMYVDNTGITQNDLLTVSFPPDAELEFMWSVTYPKPYKEFSYNGTGDIVNFDIYDTPAKAVHVFNKSFTYDGSGNLIQIVTTNLLTLLTKTRVIEYDGNGEMISETES